MRRFLDVFVIRRIGSQLLGTLKAQLKQKNVDIYRVMRDMFELDQIDAVMDGLNLAACLDHSGRGGNLFFLTF